MNRKELYKHQGTNVKNLRSKRREEESEYRKQRREKILISKRIRFDEENDDELSVTEVEKLAKAIQKSDPDVLQHLKTLRKAFSQGSALVEAFLQVDNGAALRSLVGHLTGTNAELQHEAAWCVTNMAAGTHEHTMAVLKASAPYLISFLSGQNVHLQDQCAWALGNMAGDSVEAREMLNAQGVVRPMINLLKSDVSSVVQSAAFSLSNLARGQDNSISEMMQHGIAPLILHYLSEGQNSEGVASEVAWVLTYITAKADCVAEFVKLGTIDIIVQLLVVHSQDQDEDIQIVTPLLRSLGNICSGPDEYGSQALQNGQLLGAMLSYIQSIHHHIKKESLWVLSNITAGPSEHAHAVVSAGIVPLLIQLLGASFELRRESTICLCNLCFHGPEYLTHILDNNALPGFITLLKSQDYDLTLHALQFIDMMLKNCPEQKMAFEHSDGVACLEALEYHNNSTLCGLAHELLDKYFEGEDGEDLGDDGIVTSPPVNTQQEESMSP